MFLAVVALPCFLSSSNQEFSEKIGIFPFTYNEAAKRNNKNRITGTVETKVLPVVNNDIFVECMIANVLPTFCTQWPGNGSRRIYIQLDNAKPHIMNKKNEAKWNEDAGKYGFEFVLLYQPTNRPDMNVLDLGLFNSIQSLQHQQSPRCTDEFIRVIQESFENLSSKTLNRVFLTLQSVMCEVLKVFGENYAKISHLKKEKLEREGSLPFVLPCDYGVIRDAELFVAHCDAEKR